MVIEGNSFVSKLVIITLFARTLSAEDVILNVNVKKPVAVTSDKFLSLTLDPTVLLTSNVLTSSTERSTNMARGLAPAYVRLGGPRSNSYTFKRALFLQDDLNSENFTFSEAHWVLVQQWAEKSGLEIIACLALQQTNNGEHTSSWDPRNVLDFISFSDHMGYNMSWQLGYECQSRCDISGGDLGKNVMRLRNMLDAFPRYSKSIIAGPDVIAFKSKQQQQYLQDYLNAAGNGLSVITWHPNFADTTLDSDGVTLPQDNLTTEKDILYKAIGRSVSRKPLWIAESNSEDFKNQFLGAFIWLRRLGNAAKLGIQVIMRQPDMSDLFRPSPDYWVSVLHKTLVGREVLDLKVITGNKTHVNFYCHCTRPSSKYEKGSLTIFGMNLAPTKVEASVRGLKIRHLHKYILMPGYDATNRMSAETVLLNNEPLSLRNENLPELAPVISSSGKDITLKLPSGGIGFWVVTGIKIKFCMDHEDSIDKTLLKRLTKRLEETEVEEDVGHEEETDLDAEVESVEERRTLIKQKKKKRRHRHSEEEDEERKIRRIDAKKELERLERLLKRRDNEEKKPHSLKGRLGSLTYDESLENKEDLSEERKDREGIVYRRPSGKPVSSEEIKVKLDEYRNRLTEHHETRRKHQEEVELDRSEREKWKGMISRQDDSQHSKDIVDVQRAMKTLQLISKMENVAKNLEKNEMNAKIDNLDRDRYDEVSRLTNRDVGKEKDLPLEELLKREQMKRTTNSSTFEEQFEAMYQLLTEAYLNKGRHQKDFTTNEPMKHEEAAEESKSKVRSRSRRDLEKLFGDDPLGLRKDSFFRKRSKNEDSLKERRLERRNRKKGREEMRKDTQTSIFEAKVSESNENNFYGFAYQQPPKNFPKSDVFLSTGNSSEEQGNDYDYVQDDDDENGLKGKNPRKTNDRSKSPKRKIPEPDDTWIEEENAQLYHAPHEFFEDTKVPVVRIRENLKNYGELWEAEALQKEDHADEDHREGDRVAEDIVKENVPNEYEDKKAKEIAVERLIRYYDNTRGLKSQGGVNYPKTDQKGARTNSNSRLSGRNSEPNSDVKSKENHQLSASSKKRVQTIGSGEDEEYVDFGSMEFVNSEASSEEEQTHGQRSAEGQRKTSRRTKRGLTDFKSKFVEEIIYQNDDNSKNCNYRVNRGVSGEKIKDCKNVKSVEEIKVGKNAGVNLKTLPEVVEIHCNSSNEKVNVKKSVNTKSISSEKVATIESVPMLRISQEETVEEIENFSARNSAATRETAMTNIRNEILKRNSNSSTKDSNMIQPFQEPKDKLNKVETDMQGKTGTSNGSFSLALGRVPEALWVVENSISSKNEPFRNSVDTNKTSSTKVLGDSHQKSHDPMLNEYTKVISKHENPKKIDNNDTTDIKREADQKTWTKLNVESVTNTSTENKLFKVTESKVVLPSNSSSVRANEQTHSTNSTVTNRAPKVSTIPADTSKTTSKVKESSKIRETKITPKTETLSTLMKETEGKKADLKKALNSSARLKSAENARYLEYQKKRMEKLEKLKEKLQARRAKILEQYREELLDALNKCNNDMERNLKKREILEELKKYEEFEDYADTEKLAHIITNGPVDYNRVLRQNYEDGLKDEIYVPEVDITGPLYEVRKQKVDIENHLRHIRKPEIMQYDSFDELTNNIHDPTSIQEEFLEETNVKNGRTFGSSFYAVVESLENPQIFDQNLFYDSLSAYNNNNEDITGDEEYNEDNWNPQEEEINDEAAEKLIEAEMTLSNNFELSHRLSKRSLKESTAESNKDRHTSSYLYLKNKLGEESDPGQDKLFKATEQNSSQLKDLFGKTGERNSQLEYSQNPNSRRKNLENRLKNKFEDDDIEHKYTIFKESSEKNEPVFRKEDDTNLKANPSTFSKDKLEQTKEVNREQLETKRTLKKNTQGHNSRLYNDEKFLKKYQTSFSDLPKQYSNGFRMKEYEEEEDEEVAYQKDKSSILKIENMLKLNEHELVTLIPIMSQKHSRRQRQIKNEIQKNKDDQDLNEIWTDIVRAKRDEKLLQKYVVKIEKIMAELESARRKMSDYLEQGDKLKSFEEETEEEVGDEVSKSIDVIHFEDEPLNKNKVILEENSKNNISRITDKRSSNESYDLEDKSEDYSILFFKKALPKIEDDIVGKQERLTDFTESLENFIDEYEERFNDTFKEEQNKWNSDNKNLSTEETKHYDIFRTVLTNVKKFFHFLLGVTDIFHRY